MDHSAQDAWDALNQISEVVKPASTSREDFLKECRSGKFEGVITAYCTFYSYGITGQVDQELVDALPSSLRYIAYASSSYLDTAISCDILLLICLK
jgi:D-3-phosphoglycerate dehydrogenase